MTFVLEGKLNPAISNIVDGKRIINIIYGISILLKL